MSHFYSSCEGGRGRATRCGHKTTGIRAMARIHELSVYVTGSHDNETGNDTFTIHVTLDDDRMVFDNTEPSHVQTLAPLVIRYDKNSHFIQNCLPRPLLSRKMENNMVFSCL